MSITKIITELSPSINQKNPVTLAPNQGAE
jgi:hypothetical protein